VFAWIGFLRVHRAVSGRRSSFADLLSDYYGNRR
jgi:hypothetical protein